MERIFSSIRQISLLSVRQNWKIWQINMQSFRTSAVRFMQCPVIRILFTKRGTMYLKKSKKFNIRCWRIQLTPYLKILKYILKLTVWLKGGSFIVNPEGKIVAYEVTAGNVGRNADELLRRVQASQFVHEHGDEVCPAKWQPGAETLKPSLDLVGQL